MSSERPSWALKTACRRGLSSNRSKFIFRRSWLPKNPSRAHMKRNLSDLVAGNALWSRYGGALPLNPKNVTVNLFMKPFLTWSIVITYRLYTPPRYYQLPKELNYVSYEPKMASGASGGADHDRASVLLQRCYTLPITPPCKVTRGQYGSVWVQIWSVCDDFWLYRNATRVFWSEPVPAWAGPTSQTHDISPTVSDIFKASRDSNLRSVRYIWIWFI